MASDEIVYHPVSSTMRILMVVALCVFVGGVIWTEVQRGASLNGALGRYGPFLLIGGVLAFRVYRVAHTIILRETGSVLEFRTFIGTRVLPVMDISSISPAFLQRGALVVRHAHGSVVMPAQFDGCQELLEWIRKRNPSVVFKNI